MYEKKSTIKLTLRKKIIAVGILFSVAALFAVYFFAVPALRSGEGQEEYDELDALFRMLTAAAPLGYVSTHEMLEDLEYFRYVLENNFDLLELQYRARGTDIPAIIREIEREIRDNPGMSVTGFYDHLRGRLNPDNVGGRFVFVGLRRFQTVLNNPYDYLWWAMSDASTARFTYPQVLAFYSGYEDVSNEYALARLFQAYAGNDVSINRFHETLTLHGMDETGREVVDLITRGLYTDAAALHIGADNIISTRPNTSFDILQPGRVAYLALDSFLQWPTGYDRTVINRAFDEIQGFQHLIIDLRRNPGGGMPNNFIDYILRPLMNSPTNQWVDGFVFKNVGD